MKTSNILDGNEIKAIRESMGLSRSQAGTIFGGGRGAFEKYESNERRPSISVNTLLLLARDEPQLIYEKMGLVSKDIRRQTPSPFHVKPNQLTVMSSTVQITLIERLLVAEASVYGISLNSIHVSSNPNTPDAGEDAHIAWVTKPDHTRFLPSNNCVFQLKARPFRPSDLRKEIVAKGKIKDRVREVLEKGGTYLMLCTHEYSGQFIKIREEVVLDTLREHGLNVSNSQVEFRDASKIATWLNHYHAVALWYLETIGSPEVKHFQTWETAFEKRGHSLTKFVRDARFDQLQRALQQYRVKKSPVHVKGLSGVGKTRLVLESFSGFGTLSNFKTAVAYMDAKFTSDENVISRVERLILSNTNATVIVDGGSAPANRRILEQVREADNEMSIILIEDLIDVSEEEIDEVRITEASEEVTQALVDLWCGGIHHADRNQLVQLTRGHPKFTKLICDSWRKSGSITGANPDDLVDSYVIGPTPKPDLIRKSAMITAVCGGIRKWKSKDFSSTIKILDPDLSVQNFRENVEALCRRGVIRKYGNDITLEPKIVALKLARHQWESWDADRWEQVLLRDLDLDIKESICRQLALLNQTTVAVEVVDHLFGLNGVLHTISADDWLQEHYSLLYWFVQIDTDAVIDWVEFWVDRQISSGVGGIPLAIIETLEAAAFTDTSFEHSASILMKIAAKSPNENALHALRAVFSIVGTAAGVKKRLETLRGWVEEKEQAKLNQLPQLLHSIITLEAVPRIDGTAKHGVKRSIDSWRPQTLHELQEYISEVIRLLQVLSNNKGQLGEEARTNLDTSMSRLIYLNWLDIVEDVVNEVSSDPTQSMPVTLETLWSQLQNDSGVNDDIRTRLQTIYDKLQPQSTRERLQHFLDGSLLGRYRLRRHEPKVAEEERDEIRKFAQDVRVESSLLVENLESICQCTQYGIRPFGQELAILSRNPREGLVQIKKRVIEQKFRPRVFDFMLGYIHGMSNLNEFEPEILNLKNEAAHSAALSPMLPRLCTDLGIKSSDIQIVIEAIHKKHLEPIYLMDWSRKGIFQDVSTDDFLHLLNYLADHSSDGYVVAVEILALNMSELEECQSLFHKFVFKIARLFRTQIEVFPSTSGYYFVSVMKQVLQDGPNDESARRLATILSPSLINAIRTFSISSIQDLVPYVIKVFPEIALSAIKQAVNLEPRDTQLVHELSDSNPAWDDQRWILMFPLELLLDWCHENASYATYFLGATLPFLESQEIGEEQDLHPYMRRLIEEFGHVEELWEGICVNIGSFWWKNELTTYYTRYQIPIRRLCEHESPDVRSHARKLHRTMRHELRNAQIHDAEQKGRTQY